VTAVIDTAVLAESTVIDAEKHVQARRTRPRRRDLVSAVEHHRIDPRVAQKALTLAEGDISRLRLLPDGAILVVNQGRRQWQ